MQPLQAPCTSLPISIAVTGAWRVQLAPLGGGEGVTTGSMANCCAC